MKKIFMNPKNCQNVIFFALSFGCCLPVLNKGVDVTDTSYYLLKYKHIFDDTAIGKGLGTILTNIIGGCIYNSIPTYQLLVLNVLGALAFCICGFLVWNMLNEYKHEKILFAFVFSANLFAVSFIKTLNYNSLSSLFFHIGVFLLIKGIFNNQKIALFFSGMIFALNVFTRIPNALHFVVGIAFIIEGCFEKEPKNTIQKIISWCLGIIVGLGLGTTLSLYFLDIGSLMKSLQSYSSRVGSSTDVRGISYGIQYMFGWVINGFKSTMMYLIIPVIGITALSKCIKSQKVIYVLGNAVSIVLATVFYLRNPQRNVCLSMIYFIICVILITGLIFYFKKDKKLSVLCGTALVTAVVCVFGSDTYIQVFSFYAYLPICVSVLVLNNVIKLKKCNSEIICRMVCTFLLTTVLVGGVHLFATHVYRDACYNKLTETMDESYGPYAGMKTSVTHKKALESAKNVLDEFAGEELIFLGDFNAGCLISDMTPFFSTPWPDLSSFKVEKFEIQLEEKTEKEIYPIILIANQEKFSLRDITEKKDIITSYMKKQKYTTYYEDEYITVYKKAEKLRNGYN